jgi:hypothetical protein
LLLWSHSGKTEAATPFAAFQGISVPEIPAKAAEVVQAATASNRNLTAQQALQAASLIAKPGVLPYVVSAVCQSSPETAETVVSTAIRLQPDDTLLFAKAAVRAAPEHVEQIVFSACQASPALCANIALVAYRQCPSSLDSIIAGLTQARPDFKLYLEEAELQVGPNDFDAALRKAVQFFTEAAAPPK